MRSCSEGRNGELASYVSLLRVLALLAVELSFAALLLWPIAWVTIAQHDVTLPSPGLTVKGLGERRRALIVGGTSIGRVKAGRAAAVGAVPCFSLIGELLLLGAEPPQRLANDRAARLC